jgi:acyl-CoA synthetase (AMP-forming)/AMP-acid ligase II
MPTTGPATGMPVPDITVTEQVLGMAHARGRRPALINGDDGSVTVWTEFERTVRGAADGLVRRGMRPGDVAGVYVPDAACYVLAGHAVRAAGGIPSPVRLGAPVAEMAGQLTDSGARVLLTVPALVGPALEAADRSWVRQVIAFGEVAGTIPFGSLLTAGAERESCLTRSELALLPYVRAPDGALTPASLTHQDLAAELGRLAAETELTDQDVVVAAPPSGDGRAYTALLDLALVRGATIVAASGRNVGEAVRAYQGTAVIVPQGTPVAGHPALRVFTVAP